MASWKEARNRSARSCLSDLKVASPPIWRMISIVLDWAITASWVMRTGRSSGSTGMMYSTNSSDYRCKAMSSFSPPVRSRGSAGTIPVWRRSSMSSLNADFNELLERIRHGREFGHASFEPIYYLVFPPHEILAVKRQLPAWIAKLRNDGWVVTVFSIREAIADILRQAPLRNIWLTADRN